MFPSGDPTVICEQTTIDGAAGYTISFTIPSAGWVLINFMYVFDNFIAIKINTPNYTYNFTRGQMFITDDTFTSVLLPVVEGTLSLTNAIDIANTKVTFATIYYFNSI